MTDNSIHICFGLDRNYLAPFYITLTSIFLNNRASKIIIHAMIADVGPKQKDEISSFVQGFGNDVHFYHIQPETLSKFRIPENTHFTTAIFYRLFFPLLLPPNVSKLLYFDCDIVVNCDLKDLYSSLFKNPLAATIDNEMILRSELGLYDKNEYFNSGVLLINVQEWISQKISEKAIDCLLNQSSEIKFPDQDALNIALRHNWYCLQNKFNIMRADVPKYLILENSEILKKQTIIHYNDSNKPWNINCVHPYKWIYEHYYLKFSGSVIGQKLIESNFELGFMSVMMMLQKEKLSDASTILLCAFAINICYIKIVQQQLRDSEAKNLLYAYYGLDDWPENSLPKQAIESIYNDNKLILMEYFDSIMGFEKSHKEADPQWMVVWTSLCQKELKAWSSINRKIDFKNSVIRIPQMIDRYFEIPVNGRKLLYYFINRFVF